MFAPEGALKVSSCNEFFRAGDCSLMSFNAGEHSGFLVTFCGLSRFVDIDDLFNRSILPSFGLWAIVLWIVRLVLVHVDVVPEHHVSPCSSFGSATGSVDLKFLTPPVCDLNDF